MRKNRKKVRSSQVLISINSCTKFSKAQLSLCVSLCIVQEHIYVYPESCLSLAIPVYEIVRLLVYSWGFQSIELLTYPNKRTKFNLFINHAIGLLRSDITNFDLIKNTAQEVYLKFPITI